MKKIFFLLCLTFLIISCSREEPKTYTYTSIRLEEFPDGPEGEDTWDSFVGDGPDCYLVITKNGLPLVETETHSDIIPGFAEYYDGMPQQITNLNDVYKVIIVDQDTDSSDDIMGNLSFTGSDHEASDNFTVSGSGFELVFVGTWSD